MSAAPAARPIARPVVKVFVLRSGADLAAMLSRLGGKGKGNVRSAAAAKAFHSITSKIARTRATVHRMPCGGCAVKATLFEGCDVGLALIVNPSGQLGTAAFGLCADCSRDAATAQRNALSAVRLVVPSNSKITIPGARPWTT